MAAAVAGTRLYTPDRRAAARVVRVAAAHGHRRLVLGVTWGCGEFGDACEPNRRRCGNDPATVADAFAAALADHPYFETVIFAVLDRQAGTPTYAGFTAAFPVG